MRDDRSDGGGRRRSPRNVLGEPLDICSIKPMAGFYRDGCCNTGREDVGSHTKRFLCLWTAHAPERLHDEITADYNDMIYAVTRQEIEARRKAFIRKWRLKHRAVADSLEEAGDRLFTFTRLPPSQWRSARTTNAIERLHEEFKRRIKTQTVLPSADTAAMLFWALLASGQINMRKVDGWQTLATKLIDQPIDLAA